MGGSFEAYSEAVLAPTRPDMITRHWATFVVSRAYATKEFPSAKEMVCTIGLLRRLPEIGVFPRDFLEKHITHFYAQHVPAGQPLFLEKSWCCLVHGTLDVVRFVKGKTATDESNSTWLTQDLPQSPVYNSLEEFDPLAMPSDLIRFPELTVATQLDALQSFRFGDSFGPCGDEWLVASTDVELICLPLRTLNAWNRKCCRQSILVRAGNDVALLRKCLLFQCCSVRYLQIALEELLEPHEAVYGSDPLSEWSGLCIIRTGQLQLLANTPAPAKDVRATPQDSSCPSTYELCTLGPGDSIREEDLLDGTPIPNVSCSKVVSPQLEFWILPTALRSDAEGSGLLKELRLGQEASRRALVERIVETAAWAETKRKVLQEVRSCKPRLEFPLLGRSCSS